MPAEKTTPLKSSENRRATKPIMEKRRRARINSSLSDLKTLILNALNKDPSRHSKLEKADILEMTVRHLENVQRQQISSAIATDANVLNKFKAGFNECASEVNRYISRLEATDPALRRRLLSHLGHCLTNIGTIKPPTPSPDAYTSGSTMAFPGMPSVSSPTSSTSSYSGSSTPLSKSSSLSVQIPSAGDNIFIRESHKNDLNNNQTQPSANGNSSLGGLPLIPTRLPNGELYFLMPSHADHFQSPTKDQLYSLSSQDQSRLARSSSWAPSSLLSPSVLTRRSVVSPALSESSALSPVGSEAGSDVFTEYPMSNSPQPFHSNHRFFGSESSSPNSPPSPRRMSIDCEPKDLVMKRSSDYRGDPKMEEGDNVWRPW